MSMREEVLKLAESLGDDIEHTLPSDVDFLERFYRAAYLAGAKAMQEEAENVADAAYASDHVISAIRTINPEDLAAVHHE